ncbi:MAG TPA: SPOR domain-containing protein [Bacteriovoracaceae bacterium]|nr:SPOR domain-containing protein [Bacteriovoracaceae bacterium]
MEENNKVIIFEKKEIVLVLIFVLVLIVTSFTLGIRLGKKLSMNESGIKEEDVKTVELKSTDEEDADATVAEDSKLTDEEKLKKLMDESKNRLGTELEKFSKEDAPKVSSEEVKNPAAGKFTIQLGSYNTLDEAKQFAEGFTVRGYSPIINEVKIEGKGNWYRVSLGLFNTMEEAKTYIRDEQSLFSGQDHIITEIR